jgi:hypothetical protein
VLGLGAAEAALHEILVGRSHAQTWAARRGQYGADLIAAEWSEYLSAGCVRNIWTCDACGYDFEDSVCFFSPPTHPKRQASAAGNHPDYRQVDGLVYRVAVEAQR